MLNLDPALVNQDEIRLKKRRKLLGIAAVPVIIVVLVALFFMRTGLFNVLVSIDASNGAQSASSAVIEMQKIGNIVEPYLPFYDQGYFQLLSATSLDDLDLAEGSFSESLRHDPPVGMLCSIYGNMSYTIELKADIHVESKDYKEALVLYNKAESLLYENNCASRDSSKTGIDEMSEEARERIEEKRRAAAEAANQDEDEGENDENGGESGEKEPEINEQDVQQIEEMHNQNTDEGINFLTYLQQYQSGAEIDLDSPNF